MKHNIPYHQALFIAYSDAEMQHECFRLYAEDEASYYRCMDAMMQQYKHWDCYDKRLVDDNTLTPYQQWQIAKYGDILPDEPVAPHTDEFENRQMAIDETGRMIEEHFALLQDDYWGY